MKSILEASVFFIILSYITVISLSYIKLNQDVSQKNNTRELMIDIVELYGESVEEGGTKHVVVSQQEMLDKVASADGTTYSLEYYETINGYDYYTMNISSKYKTSFFKLEKPHEFTCLVKVSKQV